MSTRETDYTMGHYAEQPPQYQFTKVPFPNCSYQEPNPGSPHPMITLQTIGSPRSSMY